VDGEGCEAIKKGRRAEEAKEAKSLKGKSSKGPQGHAPICYLKAKPSNLYSYLIRSVESLLGRLCLPCNNLTCANCNDSINSLFEVSKLQINTTIIVGAYYHRKVVWDCHAPILPISSRKPILNMNN
jgi:hypothetical protein